MGVNTPPNHPPTPPDAPALIPSSPRGKQRVFRQEPGGIHHRTSSASCGTEVRASAKESGVVTVTSVPFPGAKLSTDDHQFGSNDKRKHIPRTSDFPINVDCLATITSIREGFHIGFHADNVKCPSVNEHPEVINKYFSDEINAGRIFGPTSTPPLPNPHLSRFGFIPIRKISQTRGY